MREVKCLKEMIEMLRNRIGRKNELLKQSKDLSTQWASKNRLLNYRNRELIRIKMQPYVSQRSIMFVDSAVFSEFIGFIDSSILDTPLSVVTINDNDFRRCSEYPGKFRIIMKGRISNGEGVVLKKIHPSLNYNDEKSLTVLAVEVRVANLIGKHPNIVEYQGIYVRGSTSFLVQNYETQLTLQEIFMRRFPVTKEALSSILHGITSAMTHFHRKGFLNNNLTPSNIAIRTDCEFYTPVIVSLSLSCSEVSAKTLTIAQQQRHKETLHFPSCIRQGLTPPSYASDRYGLGLMICNIKSLLRSLSFSVDPKLEKICNDCLSLKHAITARYFINAITICCNEMGFVPDSSQ